MFVSFEALVTPLLAVISPEELVAALGGASVPNEATESLTWVSSSPLAPVLFLAVPVGVAGLHLSLQQAPEHVCVLNMC